MVSTAVASSSVTAAPASQNRAPDWDKVPFDVDCARCGHDLRELSDPVCPRCDLEFEWADAVPIEELTCAHCGYHLYGLTETRCPECGEPFKWERVLAEHRRRMRPFFEHQWRRKPVRSFLRTWVVCLRPARLWSRMDIHDPPAKFGLAGMILMLLSVAVLVNALLPAIIRCYNEWLWRGSPLAWLAFPQQLVWALREPETYLTLSITGVWLLTSFAALMIFRQSMRRYRIRWVHVLRVSAYALPTMLPLAVLASYAPVLTGAFIGAGLRAVIASCFFLLVPYAVWSIRFGYRDYLKMPHSLAVAVCSQIIALLTTVAVCNATFTPGYAGNVTYFVGWCLGVWE